MSMKILSVGNPVGLPKVFNAEDENKQTVMLVTLAMDRDFKGKDDKYGVDYVQFRAFPRSDKQGSFIWNTIEKAIADKKKVSITGSRQQNTYEKNGETVYETTNRLDEINLTGSANEVHAVGRLSRDAQFFNNNVALITLAVEQDYIAKGKTQPAVDHIQVKLFMRSEKQVETMKKHLVKGALAEVTGSVRSSNYEKDGKNIYSEEIVVDHINPFLASKPGKATAAPVAEEKTAPVAAGSNPFMN